MTNQSLPFQLFNNVLERLTTDFNLQELPRESGTTPSLLLESQSPVFSGRVGEMRRFRGDNLFQVVTISIVVPPIQLDSHMLFAFTPSDAATPHFTVDSVHAGDTYAFHLDLIPRVDLGADLYYLDKVYEPLTTVFDNTNALEGLSAPKLSPKQRAIMSPWMLAARASKDAFGNIQSAVDQYYDHWQELVTSGDLNANYSEDHLEARDQANKRLLFNPDIDLVWQQITPLIGADVADRLLATLKLCGRTATD